MIQTNCHYYKGNKPCLYQKNFNVKCNEQCKYYKKIVNRIIIIKKDALGDVLRTTPILHAIKQKFKENTHITWLTDASAIDLLKFNPLIDKIYKFDFKTLLHLEIEEFDILYNLDKDKPSLALAKKIHAKEKYGFTLNEYGNLITFNRSAEYAHLLGISDILKKSNTKTYQEIICEMLELPYNKNFKYIFEFPNRKEKEDIILKKFKIPKDNIIIGFNIGVGVKFQTKRWLTEYFSNLAIHLIKDKNYTILLLGGKLDEKYINQIYKEVKDKLPNLLKSNIINTGVDNSIFEFASLISIVNILITGDSLGLHLAIALNIKSISLFGPTSATEIELYDTGIKIVAKSPCLLCYNNKCNFEVFCLSKIKPKSIYKKILYLLNHFKE